MIIEWVTTMPVMTSLHKPIQWHKSNMPSSQIIPKKILLHVRCWNRTKKMHKVISANAVGILISTLRLYVLVYVSSEIWAIFILKYIANMNKNPKISLTFIDRRKIREVIPYGFKLTNLCQWLLERSMKMGSLPFYLAMSLRIFKAPNLSKG